MPDVHLSADVCIGVAVAMASKYGISEVSLETVVAGAAALWSIGSSIKAHLPTQAVSSDALKDAVTVAAQAAAVAIIANLQQQGVVPVAQPSSAA